MLPPPMYAAESHSKTMIRPTETIGVSYKSWVEGKDETGRSTPTTATPSSRRRIDFGPDYTAGPAQPRDGAELRGRPQGRRGWRPHQLPGGSFPARLQQSGRRAEPTVRSPTPPASGSRASRSRPATS